MKIFIGQAQTRHKVRLAKSIPWLLIFLWLMMPSAMGQSAQGSFATENHRGRGVLRVKFVEEQSYMSPVGTMHITVSTVGTPSTADRQLMVAFQLLFPRREQSVMYRRPIVLPQGSTSVTVEVPHFMIGHNYAYGRMLLYEDGRNIVDEDSSDQNFGRQGSNFFLSAQTNAQVGARGNAIATTGMSSQEANAIFRGIGTTQTPISSNVPASARFMSNAEGSRRARHVALASDDWRYYYGSDYFVLPIESLEEIQLSRPEVSASLRTFVMSGGWVNVKCANIEQAKVTVDRWLNEPSTIANASGVWTRALTTDSETGLGMGDGPFEEASVKAANGVVAKTLPYESRPYYLGTVDVFTELPSPSAQAVSTSTVSAKLQSDNDGNWFWRNLILSVGKPPVWTFCVFVALFSGLIGPGLLAFTGRMKRRSLLILLVPAISLAATLVIVSYSVFHEGLGTSIRVTGVLALDARSGNGFVWSRQNYFSGLPPRDGLVFGDATYVRPVVESDHRYYSSNPSRLVSTYVDLQGGKQIWRNWLRARQQQQLLVGHKVANFPSPIECKLSPDSQSAILRNLTSEVLPMVIVRGVKDDYYLAENLAASAELVVKANDLGSANVIGARARSKLRPVAPIELSIAGNSLMNFTNSRRRGAWTNIYGQDTVTDIVNVSFNMLLSDNLSLPPSSFITAIKNTEGVEIPLQGEIVESSILVTGSLP